MSEIIVEENVVVGKIGGRELKADVFRPAGASSPVPGFLFLPGGGWRTADRAPLKERYGIKVAKHGYVCVIGEYRVMDEAPWPVQIQDVKATIRWMGANSAGLGIDPSLIVVGGKSAGGHLALLAAGTPNVKEFEGDGGNGAVSSRVAAVVGVSPVSDVTTIARRPGMEALFGENPADDVVNEASPIFHAKEGYPPTLILHGTSDDMVPHGMSLRMFEALESAGVPADLHLYAGQDHFFDRDPLFSQAVVDAIALFISRYVPVREAVAAS